MFRVLLILLVYSASLFCVSTLLAAQYVQGDWDFCTPAHPCSHGQGDCDTDADCVNGLHCIKNVGPQYNLAKGVDVCVGTPTANDSTTSTSSDVDWAGGGVSSDVDVSNNVSTTPTTTSNTAACSNVFYAATHADICYGMPTPTSSSSTDGGTGCGFTWKPGDWNYCRNCGPCDEGQYGCDPGLNHQCKGDLICSIDRICVKP